MGIAGVLLIFLAAWNIIFTLFRAKIPIYIFSALILIFAAFLFSLRSISNFHFGPGFYILIVGLILMMASFPISKVLKKNLTTE